jgi:small subunit ribosomal protein S17
MSDNITPVVADTATAIGATTAGMPTAAVVTAAATDAAEARNRRKVREGIVASSSMSKTIVVTVVERVRHSRYSKTVQRTQRLYVHDENNEANPGDKVRVAETRPMSKLKRWRLVEVVERAR